MRKISIEKRIENALAELIESDPARYGRGGSERRKLEFQAKSIGIDNDRDEWDTGMGPGDHGTAE